MLSDPDLPLIIHCCCMRGDQYLGTITVYTGTVWPRSSSHHALLLHVGTASGLRYRIRRGLASPAAAAAPQHQGSGSALSSGGGGGGGEATPSASPYGGSQQQQMQGRAASAAGLLQRMRAGSMNTAAGGILPVAAAPMAYHTTIPGAVRGCFAAAVRRGCFTHFACLAYCYELFRFTRFTALGQALSSVCCQLCLRFACQGGCSLLCMPGYQGFTHSVCIGVPAIA